MDPGTDSTPEAGWDRLRESFVTRPHDPAVEDRRLRDRAVITEWEPPVHGLEEPMWTARDPVTGCAGIGRVEAEAYGNLAAAVHYHDEEGATTGYTKYPGTLRRRPTSGPGRGEGGGLIDWLAGAFRRD
jgi:hypothetical protein